MVNQVRLDAAYLSMAKVWGSLSEANRKKVGCLVVKNNQIISDGFNGTPTGFDNTCEGEDGETLPHVLHAESNALTKLSRSTQSCEGATLYVTLSPCFECSKLIIQSGLKRVVCYEEYSDTTGIKLLQQAGINVDFIELRIYDIKNFLWLMYFAFSLYFFNYIYFFYLESVEFVLLIG